MNNEEFRAKLSRLGVEWTIVGNKINVKCPFSKHENMEKDRQPNILIDMATDLGECHFCAAKTNSVNLIAEYEKNIEGQKSYGVPIDKSGKLKIWSIGEIFSQEFGEDEWLVKDFISKPGIMALSGVPGGYKTWLTMHIALSIAKGTPVFGEFPTLKGGVLIIDEENHIRRVKKRIGLLGFDAADSIGYLSMEGFKVDQADWVRRIIKAAKEREVSLVILDSLIRIHDRNENDAQQMSIVFNGLREFVKENISVLFTHHHRKQSDFRPGNPAQNLRGSTDILAGVDTCFSVEKEMDEDILIVRQIKARDTELMSPFTVKILKNNDPKPAPCGFEMIGNYDDGRKKADEVADLVPSLLDDGIKSKQDIEKLLKDSYGKKAISEGITIAEKDRATVERIPKGELPDGYSTKGGRHYYRKR